MLARFKAAGRAAVALERRAGLLQGPLHRALGLRVGEGLAGQPARADHQRRFALQVLQVARPGGGRVGFQGGQRLGDVDRGAALVGRPQHRGHRIDPTRLPAEIGHQVGHQRQGLGGLPRQVQQGIECAGGITFLLAQGTQRHPAPGHLRRLADRRIEQGACARPVALAQGQFRLFAAVMGQPRGKAALRLGVELQGHFQGAGPVA